LRRSRPSGRDLRERKNRTGRGRSASNYTRRRLREKVSDRKRDFDRVGNFSREKGWIPAHPRHRNLRSYNLGHDSPSSQTALALHVSAEIAARPSALPPWSPPAWVPVHAVWAQTIAFIAAGNGCAC